MNYPQTNILLDAMPAPIRNTLMAEMTRVRLPLSTSLYESNATPKSFHFLDAGIASVVTTTADGSTTEVGTLGREGAPQAVHLLGNVPLPTRCFMQMAGSGYRLPFEVMQRFFTTEPEIRSVLLPYVQYQAAMLGQVAGCNRLHAAAPRLSRWLLMIQDRTSDRTLRLTQQFLAEMIGSQRTTVSEVAAYLQGKGLIRYVRGVIEIVDGPRLEREACDCYPETRRLLQAVYELSRQRVYAREADASQHAATSTSMR